MAFDPGIRPGGLWNRPQLLGKPGRNRYPMKEQIGPRRRSGNAAKVWKEPMVALGFGWTTDPGASRVHRGGVQMEE